MPNSLASLLGTSNANMDKLDSFQEPYRTTFLNFIQEINNLGFFVDIVSGVRTSAQQAVLYGLGADGKPLNGRKPVNAAPGTSLHETGRAIDINCYNPKTKVQLNKSSSPILQWLASGIPDLATRMGITWGGTAFGKYSDTPHFQIGTNKQLKSLLPSNKYQVDDKYANQNTTPISSIANQKDSITISQFIIDHNLKNSGKQNDYISNDTLINYGNNKAEILNTLKLEDKINAQKNGITIMAVGTVIQFPTNQIGNNTDYPVNRTLSISANTNTFVEQSISDIVKDEAYKRLNINDTASGQGTLYKKFAECSVYIWSKAFSPSGDFLINVTPFVMNLQTNVGKDGGTFSLTLPHLCFPGTYDDNKNGYSNLFQNGFLHKNMMSNVISKDNIKKVTKNDIADDDDNTKKFFKRNPSFFNIYLQKQDLVFIKFEKLGSETYNDLSKKPFISPSDLNGQQFDMIGLVNNSVIGSNPISEDISIQGMDLSKLVVDDGIIFNALVAGVKDKGQYFKQTINENGVAKRLTLTTDNTASNVTYAANNNVLQDDLLNIQFISCTIQQWLVAFFTKLTSIQIVPDQMLSGYTGDNGNMQISNQNATNNSMPATGIWKICKLAVDSNLDNRRLADTNLASSNGSLYDKIKKVVQEPYVEWLMDTWGSQFIFTARAAPFSSDAFKSVPCVNVYEDSVISDNLNWSDEIYTIIHYTPKGNGLITATNAAAITAVPALMLDEYIAIWGCKQLDISTNYLDFDPPLSAESGTIVGNLEKQTQDDFQWLYNAFAYMPFTRQGTITLKGDRRIKRGMIIRYFPTGELFYVVAVTNNISFSGQTDRFTIIQVQRGIVEADYDKYFNLIIRSQGTTIGQQQPNDDVNVSYNYSLNIDNFNYLLERRQFIKNDNPL